MTLAVRAAALDADDPLAVVRDRFLLPDATVYLDGNSLGALCRPARDRVRDTVERAWQQELISSWNSHDWISLPERLGARIAPLIGAAADEVLVADTLSTNLFKLLAVALALNPGRRVILSQSDNFPTDNYIAAGLAQWLGGKRAELRTVTAEALAAADFSEVAVLSLTHVNFRTGAMHDMTALTRRAQSQGALVLWDLAHSVGVCDLALDALGVDMAVGCTYKYLNGGPGAPGFLYLNRRHLAAAENPIAGWMGHRDRFAFAPDYQGATDIRKFLTGTQCIVGMAALEGALTCFDGVAASTLRAKSEALTVLFLDALSAQPHTSTLVCITPLDPARRGSQICLRHPHAYAVAQALIAEGVVVDFRDPDIIRFGFAPMYTRFVDALVAVSALERVLGERRYAAPEFAVRRAVT